VRHRWGTRSATDSPNDVQEVAVNRVAVVLPRPPQCPLWTVEQAGFGSREMPGRQHSKPRLSGRTGRPPAALTRFLPHRRLVAGRWTYPGLARRSTQRWPRWSSRCPRQSGPGGTDAGPGTSLHAAPPAVPRRTSLLHPVVPLGNPIADPDASTVRPGSTSAEACRRFVWFVLVVDHASSTQVIDCRKSVSRCFPYATTVSSGAPGTRTLNLRIKSPQLCH
jgi:hypothetical protein